MVLLIIVSRDKSWQVVKIITRGLTNCLPTAHSPKLSLVTLNLTMVAKDTHTPCLIFRDTRKVTPLEFKTNSSLERHFVVPTYLWL